MIKLKQYTKPTASLESIITKLDALDAASISLEAYPEFFGLEASDGKGMLLKIRDLIMHMLKAVADFLRGMWDRLFTKDNEVAVTQAETTLKAIEHKPIETTPEESVAIETLVKENPALSAEPVVPEGLPKNIYTRLIKAHDAFYNQGVMVFQNDHLNNTEYFNVLATALLELIRSHAVQLNGILADDLKTLDDYRNSVTTGNAYTEIVKLLKQAGVEFTDFNYTTAFYELNRLAHDYVKTPYFVLDVDRNSVYKAKLGELKQGLRVMRDKLKDDVALRTRAQQQESAITKLTKSLNTEVQQDKAKGPAKTISELVKALLLVLRLRQEAFKVNIEFIDAVLQVMQHHSFKRGAKNA